MKHLLTVLILVLLSWTISWDAPLTGSPPDGYYLYVRDQKIDVGNVTTYVYETNYISPHTFKVSSYIGELESDNNPMITVIP